MRGDGIWIPAIPRCSDRFAVVGFSVGASRIKYMTERLDQIEREFRDHEKNQEDFVKSMRSWLRGSIITILGTAISVGVFIGSMNTRSASFEERLLKNEDKIGEIDSRLEQQR